MCSSEAIFDLSDIADKKDKDSIDFTKVPVLGDATETGLIRFY
jgi:sodium/potassium-transporting ATPase subunit alpha